MWVGWLHKHGKVQVTPAIDAGIRSQNIRFKAIACLLMLSAAWVLPAPALSAAQPLAAGGQSADMEAVSGFGGPGSVPGTLDTDRQAKCTEAARVDYVEAYFDFKRQIKENYGLAFGFDYNAIYQAAGKSLGQDTAAGGVLRMFGQ